MVLGSGGSIAAVRIVNPGGLYYPADSASCTFDPQMGGAICSITVRARVTGVRLTDPGRGYTEAPSVTITRTGANGHGATAEAVLRRPTGNSQVENLFWGRQTLYGKELLIEIAAEE